MTKTTLGNRLPTRLPATTAGVQAQQDIKTEATADATPGKALDAVETQSAPDAAVTQVSVRGTEEHRANRGVSAQALRAGNLGPDSAPAEGVQKLMGQYGIEERLGRPKERFLTWAAVIQDKLNVPGDVDAVVDHAMDKDVRRQVFLLEGILKMYAKDKPELAGALATSKELEDALGGYSYAKSMVEFGVEKGLSPEIQGFFAHEAEVHRAALSKVVEEKWMPDENGQLGGIKDLLSGLENADLGSYAEDKEFLRAELEDCVSDLDRDMVLDVAEGGYDLNELQGPSGLHEFRRDIRWFSIFAEAVDGLVQLSPRRNPLKEYKNLLITDERDPRFVTDLSTSKFVKLPAAEREDNPLTISLSLYTANMKGVLDFGGLKDQGEEIEGVAHALMGIGKNSDLESAMADAAALLGHPADFFDQSLAKGQELFEEMLDNDLYGALDNEFDEYQPADDSGVDKKPKKDKKKNKKKRKKKKKKNK